MLIPLAAHSPGLILAVLPGVNLGANITYFGSPATLLWRQALRSRGHAPGIGEFLRLGAITVSTCLPVAVAAPWLSLGLAVDLGELRFSLVDGARPRRHQSARLARWPGSSGGPEETR